MKRYKPLYDETKLKVHKANEMKHGKFLSGVYDNHGQMVHDLATMNGLMDWKTETLTAKGLDKTKRLISLYIWSTLDMGANVAQQSVANLSDDDCYEIWKAVCKIGNDKKWRGF